MSSSMSSSHAHRVTHRASAVVSRTTASFVDLPWGRVRVLVGPRGLTALDLHTPFDGKYPTAPASDPAHRAIHKQLRAYARGRLTRFSLPLDPQGTVFQTAVWRALMNIPYGATRTYGDVAAAIGRPRAARAVGMACRSNPIGLVIPCHRVVGADGSLTGYAGGLAMKARLLTHEGGRSLTDETTGRGRAAGPPLHYDACATPDFSNFNTPSRASTRITSPSRNSP